MIKTAEKIWLEELPESEWVSLDEIRKAIDTYIEVAQRNVNKPFNKNDRDEREHYIYWHSSLKTLEFLKESFFSSPSVTAGTRDNQRKEGRAEVPAKRVDASALPNVCGRCLGKGYYLGSYGIKINCPCEYERKASALSKSRSGR